jgi:hypothetical protein
MGTQAPTEILVAVHLDTPDRKAIRVSIDGDGARATWISRSQISRYELTGKTTEGTDNRGGRVTLPLANIEVPEWLARDRGFI